MKEHLWNINAKTSDIRTGGAERPVAPPIQESGRLYVGNLLYTVQRSDIMDFFTSHNFQVAQLDMSIDPMTGRNPSYCFVDLESAQEAQRARDELDGLEIFGRPVKIKPGVPKKAQTGTAGLRTKSDGFRWRYDIGVC